MTQNLPAIPLLARELRHDVRNQLFALRTAFAALSSSFSQPERLQRNLKLCSNSLDKLTSATNEYFALQSGEPTAEAIELDRMVRDSAELLAPALNAIGLKFDAQLDALKLDGRKVILAMGIRALLSAAVSGARDYIKVALTASDNAAQLEVVYLPKDKMSAETQTEIDASIDLAREVFAIHAGTVRTEKGQIVAHVPLQN